MAIAPWQHRSIEEGASGNTSSAHSAAGGQSMKEILSSIRQIIADDDAAGVPRAPSIKEAVAAFSSATEALREGDLILLDGRIAARPSPDNAFATYGAQSAGVSVGGDIGSVAPRDSFVVALQGLDLSQYPVWREISARLREPRLFALDFDPDNFAFSADGHFEGLADVLLTYRGDFVGIMDESLTLPAMVSGVVRDGQPIVEAVSVSFD